MTERDRQIKELNRLGFYHAADVLQNWHDKDYQYRAPPPPTDAEVTPLNRTGIFPQGPS